MSTENTTNGEITKEEKLKEILQQNLSGVEKFEDADQYTTAELQQIYQKIIDDFKEHVKTSDSSIEDLEAMEQHLIELQNEWDKVVANKTYTLPENVEWYGKTYTRKQVGQKIRAIFDKYECEYSYTLGMWQLVMWWMNPQKTIDYATFDSTSRILGAGGLKFKGPQEWENILVVNEYFKSCNEEYMRDILHTTLLALRHNVITDALTLKKPQPNKEDEGMVEAEAQQEGNIEMVEA